MELNIDPGRILDFHDAMLSHVQSDERVRRAWDRTNTAAAQRRRAALRQEWRDFYLRLSELHAALSEENQAKAQELLGEGGGP